jgi:hypothetical protein
MAALPGGGGYYLATASGSVYNFGSAPNHGSTYTYGITGLSGPKPLNAPIVAMATTPHGRGYWLVAADGGVFNFGTAGFYGSTYTYGITGLSGKRPLNAPIVGMVPTPDGKGYWLVAKDGGVFDFGDAKFYGSTYSYGITGLSGRRPLAAPIVGAAATPSGGGYYLVAADGGVFDFGNAHFDGSAYSIGYTGLHGPNPLPAPVAGIAPNPDGTGYWAVTQNGTVLSFGGAPSMSNVSTTGGSVPQTGLLTTNPMANPSSNLPDTFLQTCGNANYNASASNTPACIQAGLNSINQGRASEGMPNMALPGNFDSLPIDEQLFILVNKERIARGLPPIYGIASSIQPVAQYAANNNEDPYFTSANLPSVATGNWASIWSNDYSTTASVFDWMYNDGYGPHPTNLDCTGPYDPGCWGHREDILNNLASQPGMAEIAAVAYTPLQLGTDYNDSFAMGFVQVPSSSLGSLRYVYTWAQAVADGA